MDAIELARRLAAHGETEAACRAYTLALDGGADPGGQMEAAVYLFQAGGDYRIAYGCFRDLYNQGHFQKECLAIMTQAFYEPNIKSLEKRYKKNCRLLAKYPYLFRKDFIPFENLPIRFYPYDSRGYVPFYPAEERFGDYINFKNPVVSQNFFKDLDRPVLAHGVASQYELEYLNDNVRDSVRVGRENHIYLHYGDWGTFCAYLQCWNLQPLLRDKKFVFLIGEEIREYPIDFQARFGEDYSQCPLQPIGIREVNRLIWHTQLSAHNGGDFFNEVFDSHPNLLMMPSIYLSDVEEPVKEIRQALKKAESLGAFLEAVPWSSPQVLTELYYLKAPTNKDIVVALFLGAPEATFGMDLRSRISPAVFFQPHFTDVRCRLDGDGTGQAVWSSGAVEAVRGCSFLREFRYIKTFTPIRRITTSYAATVRFMYRTAKRAAAAEKKDPRRVKLIVSDAVSERIINRSFMTEPEDWLYQDSVLVRFEDGKLNPRATFTALAAFLDLPYTESMTYCSAGEKRDPHPETKGFDPISVYRTYDKYTNDVERYFLEYFMRDIYQYCGYDFYYYDGGPMDAARAVELIAGFSTLNGYMRKTWRKVTETAQVSEPGRPLTAEEREQIQNCLLDAYIRETGENRANIAKLLLGKLRFVSPNGQPLRMMPLLELDPALLEQPLYH